VDTDALIGAVSRTDKNEGLFSIRSSEQAYSNGPLLLEKRSASNKIRYLHKMEFTRVFKSVTQNKCPHCLQGDFFLSRNPYNLKKLGDMHNTCTSCGMDFRQEPGFYLGAAIMSYGLQVIMVCVTYLIFQVAIEIRFQYFIILIASVLILMAPVTFRTSRILWINLLGSVPKKD
jgi:uncharacterized protein (DUF983 family)